MNKADNTLKAGFGAAPMRFEKSFFEVVQKDGTVGHLDGFNGKTHSFECYGKQVVDDLYTRVMLVEDRERAAIVALEIAQAPQDQVEYTKEIVGSICGVRPENVWVHVTHQFGFMHRMGDPEKAAIYDETMKKAAKEAAEAAVANLQPARAGIGTGECHVSANKNIINPEAPGEGPYYGPGSTLETDPDLTVIKFESVGSGQTLGFFMSYGTKPSALCVTGKNVGNREVNTEVTGQASKWMEQRFGVQCLFCMPAAGDQYPRRTAQYYGFDETGTWRLIDIGFEEGIKIVDCLGKEMGLDAVSVAERIECDHTSAPVSLYETAFSYKNKAGDSLISIPVSVFVLGDTALVGFRQEMDCVTGQQIRDASPYRTTLMVSFLNGDGKYFGHREAYDFNNGCGTWETARSAFEVGAAEEFVRVASDFLADIRNGRGNDEKWLQMKKDNARGKILFFSKTEFAGSSWYVLEKKKGRMFLLSENALARRAYNDSPEDATWESCSLRAWLNGPFMDRFSDEDKARILTVNNVNHSNPRYAIAGGNDTEDKVFLLSLEEAELFLGGFRDILCCKEEGTQEPVWWYLRSPGEAGDVAACVSVSGAIDYHGNAEKPEAAEGGIRPCMWIRSSD